MVNIDKIRRERFAYLGVLTGSVYRDYALLKNGFPAESISNGSVIAVKTHEYGSQALKDFDKAILLVRDPFSSVLAEFNRRWGGHIGHANSAKFRRENGKVWRDFVLTKGEAWETMNLDWALNFKGPRLVVFYWQLCKNTEEELKRILEFLEIQISDEVHNSNGLFTLFQVDLLFIEWHV